LSWSGEHPAAAPDAQGKVCADPRCATLLASDAEICDECGGTVFDELADLPAMLCGWADERPVVFLLPEDRPAIVGRSVPGGQPPDIDLRRFPGSGVVHRRHAMIELQDGEWRVTHLGSNPLVVRGSESMALSTGETAPLHARDSLQVGDVALQFVLRRLARRI
jgi:hypothetical protein